MKSDRIGRNPYKWGITLLAVVTVIGVIWMLIHRVSGQTGEGASGTTSSSVFSPAHSSVREAIKHFFFIRSEPTQPIAYVHKVHVIDNEMACDFCHDGVAKGPRATIPNIKDCMLCHESTIPDHPEIKKMAEYQKRGEDIPWQRVYGFTDEGHVRFNHAPHFRANVDCETCHGDIGSMTVAQRVVNHTMGFCRDCHNQRQVSDDCMTCHY